MLSSCTCPLGLALPLPSLGLTEELSFRDRSQGFPWEGVGTVSG